MTCHDAREWLSDLVDGALEGEVRAKVDAHLAECAECRRELERLRATVALLRAIEPPRAPAGFVDRVLEAARPAPWYRRFLKRLAAVRLLRFPVEAAAIVLVASLAVYVFQGTPALRRAARFGEAPAPVPDNPVPAAPPTHETIAREELSADSARTQPESRRVPPQSTPHPATPGQRPVAGGDSARKASEQRFNLATGSAPGSLPDSPPSSGPFGRTDSNGAPPAPEPPPESSILRSREQEQGRTERSGPAATPPFRQAAPPSAMAIAPSGHVVGRLIVKDRRAAARELAELLAGIGGAETARRSEAGGDTIDVVVPRAAYPTFVLSLTRLGSWVPEAEPPALPDRVPITLRITQ